MNYPRNRSVLKNLTVQVAQVSFFEKIWASPFYMPALLSRKQGGIFLQNRVNIIVLHELQACICKAFQGEAIVIYASP